MSTGGWVSGFVSSPPGHSTSGSYTSASVDGSSTGSSQEPRSSQPASVSPDEAYYKALVSHQVLRLDRMKKECESSRAELRRLREDIETKKLSHSVFVEQNTGYPTEENLELLQGQTTSLKADIDVMKARLSSYRSITAREDQQESEQQWTCKYCTALNHPAMTTTCEVCEMPRMSN